MNPKSEGATSQAGDQKDRARYSQVTPTADMEKMQVGDANSGGGDEAVRRPKGGYDKAGR